MVIKSALSDCTLTFSDLQGEHVVVSVSRHDLSATERVSLSMDPLGIAKLFRSMASDWRGWQGVRSWGALDGEMTLAAKHDRVGGVTLDLELRHELGAADSWRVQVPLALEAGQLESLAEEAERFFGKR